MENTHGSKVGKLSVDTPSQVSQVLNEANSVLYETTCSPLKLTNTFSALESEDEVENLAVEKSSKVKYPTHQPEVIDTCSPLPINAADEQLHTSSTPALSTASSVTSKSVDAEAKLNIVIESLNRIESKMVLIDKKLEKLDLLEQRVAKFESEITKVWATISDQNKKADEKAQYLEEKIESTDFSLGVMSEKVLNSERERDMIRNEVVYLQSQSMRNNLLFTNISEAQGGVTETQSETESKLRELLETKMKIAHDIVKSIVFERVHRTGRKTESRSRSIVAKFALFKEREMVRKQGKALEGTQYRVFEQFPPEIIEKRKQLITKMKEARRNNQAAWLSYDTLYINGKPVKANSDR